VIRSMHWFVCIAFACVWVLGCLAEPLGNSYSIGTYYYPGWSPGIKGPALPDPWLPIRAYPDRQPALGWYHDGRVEVVEKQLQWMSEYEIDFVVFDWYWDAGRAAPETALRAYLRAPSRNKVRYALLWANHFQIANAILQWDKMVGYWLTQHLKNPEYLRIDDKPVVFMFSGDFFRDNALSAGTTAKVMLDNAQAKARSAGLSGIYFVLCTPALEYWAKGFAKEAGFSALTAYNYHSGMSGEPDSVTRMSHTYKELDADYQMHWKWILKNSTLPYFLPMTSGWDKRPWGGTSDDRLHDLSVSTADEFERHLRAAKSTMDADPDKTKRMGMICCWNEFGEGAYIEPTVSVGEAYLERIKDVFGDKK